MVIKGTGKQERLPGEGLQAYMDRLAADEIARRRNERDQARTSDANKEASNDFGNERRDSGQVSGDDAADSVAMPLRLSQPTSATSSQETGDTAEDVLRRFGARKEPVDKSAVANSAAHVDQRSLKAKESAKARQNPTSDDYLGFGNESPPQGPKPVLKAKPKAMIPSDASNKSGIKNTTKPPATARPTKTAKSTNKSRESSDSSKQKKFASEQPPNTGSTSKALGNSVLKTPVSVSTSMRKDPTGTAPANANGKRPAMETSQHDNERKISLSTLPKIQKRTSVASPHSPDQNFEPISNDLLPGSDGKTPLWYEKSTAPSRRGDADTNLLLQRLLAAITKVDKPYMRSNNQAMLDNYATVSEILHKLAFTLVTGEMLRSNRMLHRDSGLRKIFDGDVAQHGWPFHIKADAEELFNKWSRKVFETGLLRGLIKKKDGRNSDSIDPSYNGRVDCKHFGTNDLLNGQWWPTQLCTNRDGAHGMSQSGIAGKKGEGAYSVVMTGEGGYPDEDHGDWVLYCGTDSKDGTVTKDTQLLLDSLASGNPVRLIRSYKLGKSVKGGPVKSVWAPTHGYRYDGVYRVVSVEHLTSNPLAARHRFRMERMPNQDPIRGKESLGARPTAQEVEAYEEDKRFR